MDLREILDKFSLLPYKKVSLDKFRSSFEGTLYVTGEYLDSKILDFITDINLTNIDKLMILTPYSNIDNKFTYSWSGLEKYLIGSKLKIDVIMKAPKEAIPRDIYFMDNKSIFFVPRNSFKKGIIECCVNNNKNRRQEIMKALASAEDFSTLKGLYLFHRKFSNIFQINKRYINRAEKEKTLDALVSWETSGYDDIEPLWRIFERKIRKFIKIRLEKESPDDWFTTRVLPCFKDNLEILNSIMNRFEKTKKGLKIDNINKHHNPNEYLDAENYEQIINNKLNRNLFKDYRNKSNRKYKDYVKDVVKARNAIIHSRTPDTDAEVLSNIIVKLLISIEWLNKIEQGLFE